MPRNNPVTAVLKTACGCEKTIMLPEMQDVIKVSIRSFGANLDPNPDRIYDRGLTVRVFERSSILSTSEVMPIVEYREVVSPAPKPPTFEVVSFDSLGNWVRMHVNRVLLDASGSHVTLEVI